VYSEKFLCAVCVQNSQKKIVNMLLLSHSVVPDRHVFKTRSMKVCGTKSLNLALFLQSV